MATNRLGAEPPKQPGEIRRWRTVGGDLFAEIEGQQGAVVLESAMPGEAGTVRGGAAAQQQAAISGVEAARGRGEITAAREADLRFQARNTGNIQETITPPSQGGRVLDPALAQSGQPQPGQNFQLAPPEQLAQLQSEAQQQQDQPGVLRRAAGAVGSFLRESPAGELLGLSQPGQTGLEGIGLGEQLTPGQSAAMEAKARADVGSIGVGGGTVIGLSKAGLKTFGRTLITRVVPKKVGAVVKPSPGLMPLVRKAITETERLALDRSIRAGKTGTEFLVKKYGTNNVKTALIRKSNLDIKAYFKVLREGHDQALRGTLTPAGQAAARGILTKVGGKPVNPKAVQLNLDILKKTILANKGKIGATIGLSLLSAEVYQLSYRANPAGDIGTSAGILYKEAAKAGNTEAMDELDQMLQETKDWLDSWRSYIPFTTVEIEKKKVEIGIKAGGIYRASMEAGEAENLKRTIAEAKNDKKFILSDLSKLTAKAEGNPQLLKDIRQLTDQVQNTPDEEMEEFVLTIYPTIAELSLLVEQSRQATIEKRTADRVAYDAEISQRIEEAWIRKVAYNEGRDAMYADIAQRQETRDREDPGQSMLAFSGVF